MKKEKIANAVMQKMANILKKIFNTFVWKRMTVLQKQVFKLAIKCKKVTEKIANIYFKNIWKFAWKLKHMHKMAPPPKRQEENWTLFEKEISNTICNNLREKVIMKILDKIYQQSLKILQNVTEDRAKCA